jgi:hypothetical protein
MAAVSNTRRRSPCRRQCQDLLVDRETLERRLTVALSNLIVDEWRLLTVWESAHGPGNERAAAAAFGWDLRAVMERFWDVDCEYNRRGVSDTAAVKRWANPPAGEASGRLVAPVVKPDLIIHRRGLSGPEDNLLVVELKKLDDDEDEATANTSRGSMASIRDVQTSFGYQHAVFLNLCLEPLGPAPRWTWAKLVNPKGPRPWRSRVTGPSAPVYDAKSLGALRRRAEADEARRYN